MSIFWSAIWEPLLFINWHPAHRTPRHPESLSSLSSLSQSVLWICEIIRSSRKHSSAWRQYIETVHRAGQDCKCTQALNIYIVKFFSSSKKPISKIGIPQSQTWQPMWKSGRKIFIGSQYKYLRPRENGEMCLREGAGWVLETYTFPNRALNAPLINLREASDLFFPTFYVCVVSSSPRWSDVTSLPASLPRIPTTFLFSPFYTESVQL